MRFDRAAAAAALICALGCHVDTGDLFRKGVPQGATPTVFYISPAGSDANSGSEDAPWLTFDHALPRLGPGMTLVLEDGTYEGATTGYLRAFCGTNAVNGTLAQPITVRAQNERQALLKDDGSGAPLELSACANWNVTGLYAEGSDHQGEGGDEAGSVIVLSHGCTNVHLSRVVGAHPNRYMQASVYVIALGAPNVVIEESEALDFVYFGFHAYGSMQPVFRRDYAHSRDTADLPGGYVSSPPTQGDGGFMLTETPGGVIENCIAEDVADGFVIAASHAAPGSPLLPMHDALMGDIANDVTHAGFVVASHCDSLKPCNAVDTIVSDARLENDVARGGALGVSVEGAPNVTIQNTSVFDVTDTGIALGLTPENAGLTSSATVEASLVTAPGAAFGFQATGQASWSFSSCNTFGPAQTYAPLDTHVMNSTEIDPQLGACLVNVPAGSPFASPAPGVPVAGASTAFAYENGALTTTKLWDQTTGQFPCGATIPGENDDARADVSCIGVASRLHVGAMGCGIP